MYCSNIQVTHPPSVDSSVSVKGWDTHFFSRPGPKTSRKLFVSLRGDACVYFYEIFNKCSITHKPKVDIKHAAGRLNETLSGRKPRNLRKLPWARRGLFGRCSSGTKLRYVVKQNEIVGADLLSSLVVGTGSNRYKLWVETSLDEASTVT